MSTFKLFELIFLLRAKYPYKEVRFLNLTDLKQDFYKRFSASNSFLAYSRMGLLCPLLGNTSIKHSPSLNCSLSMKIQLYGRQLAGEMIKLQSTKNNLCVVFRFGTRPPSQHTELFEMLEKMRGYGIGGAELFFDSSIPTFFPSECELKAAVFDVISRIYNIDIPMSVCGNKSVYNALLNAQKGYCISEPDGKKLPLPLTGYKFLILQTEAIDKTPRAKYIEKAYERLKRIYPHIHSLADLSPDRLEYSRSAIRDKTALNYVRHLVDENERIQIASQGLKQCSITALTEQINQSELSIEKLWNPERQHVFLVHRIIRCDNVVCAKVWENGIFAIIKDENIDETVNKIIYDFETAAGYKPFVCIADTFGD